MPDIESIEQAVSQQPEDQQAGAQDFMDNLQKQRWRLDNLYEISSSFLFAITHYKLMLPISPCYLLLECFIVSY